MLVEPRLGSLASWSLLLPYAVHLQTENRLHRNEFVPARQFLIASSLTTGLWWADDHQRQEISIGKLSSKQFRHESFSRAEGFRLYIDDRFLRLISGLKVNRMHTRSILCNWRHNFNITYNLLGYVVTARAEKSINFYFLSLSRFLFFTIEWIHVRIEGMKLYFSYFKSTT